MVKGLAALLLVCAPAASGWCGEGSYGRTPDKLLPYSGDESPPYRKVFEEPPVFRGAGRDKPEPKGLKSVRIGLLAPLDGTRDDDQGRALKQGVELAIEEANAAGGRDGVPYELIVKNDADPWGNSSNQIVEFAYEDRVWVIIGSIDSDSTHVGIRAALKAELPMITVGSNDPTITETGIPWVMRVTQDDRQVGYRLARLFFEEKGLSNVYLLRSSDRYGRFGIREFRDAAKRLGKPIPAEVQARAGEKDFSAQLDRIAAGKAEGVALWLRAPEAAEFVRQLRERGMKQAVAGTDRLVDDGFLSLAKDHAEGVEAVSWLDTGPKDPAWSSFSKRFQTRYETAPTPFSGFGYDAARLVLKAIDAEGLNRARIMDFLAGLASYEGVSGRMEFDRVYQNVAPLKVGRVQKGRFVFRD